MTPDYLDCNATTPLDPRVRAEMLFYFDVEYGNASSPHDFGIRAKAAVGRARNLVATLVGARRHEVFFTSGATESNNLALLGLADHGRQCGRRHVVSTRIEHAAVLEPLVELRRQGFEITLVPPTPGGWVEAAAVAAAVRHDTLAVSVMHVNNETGVRQPITEIAERLAGTEVFFHVDAAQGFGKEIEPLRHPRIDFISLSGHKIYGPKGVGALVVRRRGSELPPLRPLMFGGGHELGLRPGTLPVPLVAGLGKAAELAANEWAARAAACQQVRARLLAALADLDPRIHGVPERTLPHVLNLSLPGVHGDELVETLGPVAAVSNGSACTSVCATASHVLKAMGVPADEIDGAVRLSWYHGTELTRLDEMLATLRRLTRNIHAAPKGAIEARSASEENA